MITRISRSDLAEETIRVAVLEDGPRISKDLVGMLILVVILIVVLLLTGGSVGG